MALPAQFRHYLARSPVMLKNVIPAAILSLVLFGCTSVLSNQIIQQADEKISFQDLQKQPQQYRGAVVILGGQIVETVVKEGETWVQILQLPLGAEQRPDITAPSQGRFIMVYMRFVDPLIYEKGRKITVAGVVEGSSVITLKDVPYNAPVLLERETYLWKAEAYPGYRTGPAVQFGIGVGVSR
jgi:outer membrane lipoprotein